MSFVSVGGGFAVVGGGVMNDDDDVVVVAAARCASRERKKKPRVLMLRKSWTIGAGLRAQKHIVIGDIILIMRLQ